MHKFPKRGLRLKTQSTRGDSSVSINSCKISDVGPGGMSRCLLPASYRQQGRGLDETMTCSLLRPGAGHRRRIQLVTAKKPFWCGRRCGSAEEDHATQQAGQQRFRPTVGSPDIEQHLQTPRISGAMKAGHRRFLHRLAGRRLKPAPVRARATTRRSQSNPVATRRDTGSASSHRRGMSSTRRHEPARLRQAGLLGTSLRGSWPKPK